MFRSTYPFAFVALVLMSTPGGVANQPADGDNIDPNLRYGPRKIEIVLGNNYPVNQRAHIRVSYKLTNLTKDQRQLKHPFPVFVSSGFGAPQSDFRVQVDDRPVKFTLEPLQSPTTELQPVGFGTKRNEVFSQQEMETWRDRLEEWMQRDPALSAMLVRYRGLREELSTSQALYDQFDQEMKRQLIHNQDCHYAAFQVATGHADLRYLVKLMPEVDPSLRFDIDDRNRKYISYLDEYHPQSYSAYESAWRQQAENWLLSIPGFDELIPKLRHLAELHEQSEQLLNHEIVNHLHDQCGLSRELSLQLGSYLNSQPPAGTPPRKVIEQLFPEVRQTREKRDAEISERLQHWGFDGKQLSPLTGRLYHGTGHTQPDRFSGYDPPSLTPFIEAIERGEEPAIPPTDSRHSQRSRPCLLSFDLILAGNGTSSIVVEYETILAIPLHPLDARGFPIHPSELVSILPPDARKTAVEIDITVPPGFHPVISPPPATIDTNQNGSRHFSIQRKTLPQNIHMRLFELRNENTHGMQTFLSLFHCGPLKPHPDSAELLERLLATIENSTVRPLLLLARSFLPDQIGDVEAYQASLQLEKEFPEFAGLPQLRRELEEGDLTQVSETYNWIQQKSRSPVFQEDDDFRRVGRSSDESDTPLHPQDFELLITNVQALDTAELSLEEKLGKYYLLCEAGIAPEQNLAAILDLADSDDSAVIPALRLIEGLSIEKPHALPFVLKHLGIKTLPVKDPRRPRQYAASQAMYSFRSSEVAKPLIEFIGSTEDSYFIQTAINVMSEMSLPELFDDLIAVADRVVHSSESAFYNYRDLLVQSNPEAAEPVLKELYRKFPNYAPRDSMPREKAVETYNTSDDKDQIQSAVMSLKALGDPSVITELTYREGFEDWNNQQLLWLITQKRNFREAFPFVENYYHEFVVKSVKGNPYECINAFEATGDLRAIPYLQEIVRTYELKTDAAHAIGALLLKNYQPDSYGNEMAELGNLIHKIDRPDQSAEMEETVLKRLLEDPESSMALIIRFSRIGDLVSRESPADWRDQDRERFQYLVQFGTIAAKHLLEASRKASLQSRYNVAHLLSLLPEESYALVRDAAKDPDTDSETRRASILALGMTGDAGSVPVLAELMNDEAYRGNAIDALAHIKTEAARKVLQRWKKMLEADRPLTLRRDVWLSKIQRALDEPQ